MMKSPGNYSEMIACIVQELQQKGEELAERLQRVQKLVQALQNGEDVDFRVDPRVGDILDYGDEERLRYFGEAIQAWPNPKSEPGEGYW